MGLATAVVSNDQLDERARALCAAVVANPPAAVRGVKQLLLGADQRDPSAHAALERRIQTPLLGRLTRPT